VRIFFACVLILTGCLVAYIGWTGYHFIATRPGPATFYVFDIECDATYAVYGMAVISFVLLGAGLFLLVNNCPPTVERVRP
jgi:hypothetical protein